MGASIIMLMQKLREMKESLGEKSLAKIHVMLNEAEEHALRIQRESPEQARRESRRQSPGMFTR